ncbi:MAG: hypothetical protein ACT6FC_06240 [Methanosarcinaceae archaeon]
MVKKLKMLEKKLIIPVVVTLVSLIAACGIQSVSNEAASIKTPIFISSSPTTLYLTTPTPTIPATVTAIALSSNTQDLKNIVFSSCIRKELTIPEYMQIPWNLLIVQNGFVNILNPEDGTMIEIPYFNEKTSDGHNKFTHNIYISPDGKWLAYTDASREKLFVEPVGTLSINGEEKRIILEYEHRIFLRKWIDIDTVLVMYPPLEEGAFYPTVFLDPFTMEEHIFLLDELPNHLIMKYGGAVILTHYINGEVVPDPTMKYLIYPEQREDSKSYNILWDIENEKPLAYLRFLDNSVQNPLWAQDSSDVLVKGPNPELRQTYREEWYLISDNGAVRQVTQFQDIFLDGYYSISRSSRSWDGQFVVFVLYYEEPEKITKYILLDLKANGIEGYCIPLSGSSSPLYEPVWSPDNKYLIISSNDDDGRIDNILVDVENRKAYSIAQDANVIGWIAKP